MAQPELLVLASLDGSGSLNGASGQQIRKELAQIAQAISSREPPKISLQIDMPATQRKFQTQLQNIVKGIQLNADVQLKLSSNTANSSSNAGQFQNITKNIKELNSMLAGATKETFSLGSAFSSLWLSLMHI